MIPRYNEVYTHIPLPAGCLKWQGREEVIAEVEEYEQELGPSAISKSLGLDGAQAKAASDIQHAIMQGLCPYTSLSRALRPLVDPGIPVTNAFCKMYEMCWDTPVGRKIDELTSHQLPVRVCCLAEAPGTFPFSILYYIGMTAPGTLERNEYEYRCTTLYIDDEQSTALKDSYSLIGRNKQRWHFMNHDFPEDTREMERALGAGTFDVVTGDIGKPRPNFTYSEYEWFKEQYGQFVAALCLLKEGGVSCLKMLSCRLPPCLSMLRVAVGVFERVMVYKPRSSHTSNRETYWIGIGFKRALFLPIRESLISFQQGALDTDEENRVHGLKSPEGDVIDPSYAAFTLETTDEERAVMDEMRERQFRSSAVWGIRRAVLEREADRRVREIMMRPGKKPEGWMVKRDVARELYRETGDDYIGEWVRRYPIAKLGELGYRITNMRPGAAPQRQEEEVYEGREDEADERT
jgi:hypothetical protein